MLDIKNIIENRQIHIFFQPIISIKNKKIFGFEALTRAKIDGKLIPPNILFQKAKEQNLIVELDKITRLLAIDEFKKLYEKDKKLFLFLNIESSIIDTDWSSHNLEFDKKLLKLEIPTDRVVLEIKEDFIKNNQNLEGFCNHYRELGFNIGLDDFGVGLSSFDRLAIVKPDIIKIDRSLISNVRSNYFHREIVKAIANMSKQIGSLVLAEGIENLEDITSLLKHDIFLYQGFYFEKAVEPEQLKSLSINEKITKVSNNFHSILAKRKNQRFKVLNESLKIALEIEDIFIQNRDIKNRIFTFLKDNAISVEAIYFIDEYGKQLNETMFLTEKKSCYEPAKDGDDHSFRNYFYMTKESKNDFFLSEKYLSLASGNLCRTFSKKTNLYNKELIICLDFTIN